LKGVQNTTSFSKGNANYVQSCRDRPRTTQARDSQSIKHGEKPIRHSKIEEQGWNYWDVESTQTTTIPWLNTSQHTKNQRIGCMRLVIVECSSVKTHAHLSNNAISGIKGILSSQRFVFHIKIMHQWPLAKTAFSPTRQHTLLARHP